MTKEIICNEDGKFNITLTLSKDGFCFCPVCGEKSKNKEWRPYDTLGYPTHDICKCGFEYGYDCGPDGPHEKSWENYRKEWFAGQLKFGNSKTLDKSKKLEQLKNIGVDIKNI